MPLPPAKRLLGWYRKCRRNLPWRLTRDPYAILVSEVMLQQTQVATVIPYYGRWMREFPAARELAAAPEERVLKLWEGLGYYRRARNLQAAARMMVERWNGKFPRTLEELLMLPGVGRYTAGAVGSIAFGLPLPVVDGNVARVLARLLGIRDSVRKPEIQARLWETMEKWLPAGAPGDFNQAIMELGAIVCLPRNPRCGNCPLAGRCIAAQNGWQMEIPRMERPRAVGRSEFALLARSGRRIWLEQRSNGQWHEGLWALPSIVRESAAAGWEAELQIRYGWKVVGTGPMYLVRYQVTRHKVELKIYEGTALPGCAKSGLRSCTPAEAAALPLVTAHRRSLERLGVIEGPSRCRRP